MKLLFDFSQQRISIEGDGPELLELAAIARELAPKLPKLEIHTVGESLNGSGEGPKDPPANDLGMKKSGETVRQLSLIHI